MMPSKTLKQKRTMAAAAHNPAFAAKVGIPVSVAKEYGTADTAKHLANALRAKKGRSK
jgi:hypothetical protein